LPTISGASPIHRAGEVQQMRRGLLRRKLDLHRSFDDTPRTARGIAGAIHRLAFLEFAQAQPRQHLGAKMLRRERKPAVIGEDGGRCGFPGHD
jgi:hypothetical protein